MEFCQQQKVNLSFSIENILRDDFPRRRRTNVVNQPTRETNFEQWSDMAVYQYYAAQYSPVVVRRLPNMYRIGERCNAFNRGKEHILYQEHNTIEDCSSWQDGTVLQNKNGPEINANREGKKLLITQTNINENILRKKKKRNRGHFTKHQLQSLEKLFSRQKYLTRDERTLLARSLGMTELQIRNWFQNQRYLKKRHASEKPKKDEPDSSTTCVGR